MISGLFWLFVESEIHLICHDLSRWIKIALLVSVSNLSKVIKPSPPKLCRLIMDKYRSKEIVGMGRTVASLVEFYHKRNFFSEG